VQEPLVLEKPEKLNAEELTEEAAEDFTPEDTEEQEDITTEEHITKSHFSERKFMKKLWENIPEEKQKEDVEKIRHAESEWEEKLEKEKSTLEELHWKHVLADQNFQKNVKKTLRLQEDAPENSTDVQEDVWEKHAELVQELHVQQRKLKEQNWKNAEELAEEVAEDFTAEDTEEQEEFTTEEPTTKRKKRKFTTKEKKRLLCSRKNSLKRNWQHSPKEKQKENALMTKNAELE